MICYFISFFPAFLLDKWEHCVRCIPRNFKVFIAIVGGIVLYYIFNGTEKCIRLFCSLLMILLACCLSSTPFLPLSLILLFLKKNSILAWALAKVAQLVGASSCKLKGHRFDSQSGYMPGSSHRGEATDRCFSLASIFLSLPPPLSKSQ